MILFYKIVGNDAHRNDVDPEFMIGTIERTGLSLPLDGSEDAEIIRFDGQGVHSVSVDSDSDSEAEPNEDSEEPEEDSDIGEIMSDNDKSDYTDGEE